MADRWSQFATWAKDMAAIKDMRQIETSTLRDYATHLIARLERGEISPATAQNALSTVNRVLEIARGDRAVRLDPVREAGCRSVAASPPPIAPCRCPSTTTPWLPSPNAWPPC
ncbi:hypothetical protein [Aeromonas caviae]|uniref:hypothetical protein n=1 Tax=Aeromonas caviae TaxID=648 RepID=UPI001F355182|nr:hypothetical protein [Aeromonas caviae]